MPPSDLTKTDLAPAGRLPRSRTATELAAPPSSPPRARTRRRARPAPPAHPIVGAVCTAVGRCRGSARPARPARRRHHLPHVHSASPAGSCCGPGCSSSATCWFGNRFKLGFWIAMVCLVLIVVVAVFADLLPIDGYDDPVVEERDERPALSWDEPLGRDDFGRSLLSRIVYGARVSLADRRHRGHASACSSAARSACSPATSAGWLDEVVGIMTNSVLAFPPLILLLARGLGDRPDVDEPVPGAVHRHRADVRPARARPDARLRAAGVRARGPLDGRQAPAASSRARSCPTWPCRCSPTCSSSSPR